MKQHFLIVGQGLAGSLLAHALIEREQAVTVIDNDSSNSASRIAAGLINPLTGQRLVMAAEVKQCFPFAMDYYSRLAEQFGQSFYTSKALLRLFQNASDKDRYQSRRSDESYNEYLGEKFNAGESTEPVKDACGGFEQHSTGHLDIKSLLNSLRNYMRERANFVEGMFEYSELQIGEDCVRWRGKEYDHVVFCEGAKAIDNPWFRWLPFQLSKGEIITIESQKPLPKRIISKSHWLLPLDQQQAKFGASYTWQWHDEQPTKEMRDELLRSCGDMLMYSDSVKLANHQAGIRPTTKDKQAFIGTHPDYARAHCFNGFGSKGSLLIPYYSACLVDNLLSSKALPDSVNIKRFDSPTSLVMLARRFLSTHINPGDCVIDATLGNGNDTELCARCVGEQGRVLGFDIQDKAITNTRQRLLTSDLLNRVTLILDNHGNMKRHINDELQQKLSTIVFNLGFLPGSDKTTTTSTDTTLTALNEAAIIINPNGLILIMTYPGHACGKNETEAVKQWINHLDDTRFHCRSIETKQKTDAPSLFLITKLKQ